MLSGPFIVFITLFVILYKYDQYQYKKHNKNKP